MTDVDDFLAHYGVIGMKWGKHRAARAEAKTASYHANYEKKLNEYKDLADNYVNKYSSMSAAELRDHRAKISQKIDKLDMNMVVAGLGGLAPRTPRINKQAEKRGDKTPYQTLSAVDKEKIELSKNKATRVKAISKSLILGTLETTALLGASHVLISKSNLNPVNKKKAEIQIGLLVAGTAGSVKIQQLRALSQASRYLELTNRRSLINRSLNKKK